jgi:hypothetical protein
MPFTREGKSYQGEFGSKSDEPCFSYRTIAYFGISVCPTRRHVARAWGRNGQVGWLGRGRQGDVT